MEMMMFKTTENWINDRLSDVGLGPVDRDEDFWAQLWSHALSGAQSIADLSSKERSPREVHVLARVLFVRAVEVLWYGEAGMELPSWVPPPEFKQAA